MTSTPSAPIPKLQSHSFSLSFLKYQSGRLKWRRSRKQLPVPCILMKLLGVNVNVNSFDDCMNIIIIALYLIQFQYHIIIFLQLQMKQQQLYPGSSHIQQIPRIIQIETVPDNQILIPIPHHRQPHAPSILRQVVIPYKIKPPKQQHMTIEHKKQYIAQQIKIHSKAQYAKEGIARIFTAIFDADRFYDVADHCMAEDAGVKFVMMRKQLEYYSGYYYQVRGDSWPNIQSISLSGFEIDPQNFQFFCQTELPWLMSLTLCDIKHPKIQQMYTHLRNAKWPKLHYLSLRYCDINEQCMKSICERNWPLYHLDLTSNKIGAFGRSLMEWTGNKLQNLNLQGNLLGSRGVQIFSKGSWTYLNQFSLNCNQIGVEGAKNITKTKLPNLKILKLQNNKIKDEGFSHLSNLFAPLTKLEIISNGLTTLSTAPCMTISSSVKNEILERWDRQKQQLELEQINKFQDIDIVQILLE